MANRTLTFVPGTTVRVDKNSPHANVGVNLVLSSLGSNGLPNILLACLTRPTTTDGAAPPRRRGEQLVYGRWQTRLGRLDAGTPHGAARVRRVSVYAGRDSLS